MDANTTIAICATGIALISLVTSIFEARAVRQHNRNAVRPLLELWVYRNDSQAGIKIVNRGLGPAIITNTALTLDGDPVGAWEIANLRDLRNSLPARPRIMTFEGPRALPTGFEGPLFALTDFDRHEHNWFWELIHRMDLEIYYESLYGGENFKIKLYSVPPR
ncbi:hypothetical protein [Actinomadura kijaniata]|uniref:hypothetical protein n=1 Tax=Actinomadura kijaniata TaxID=46161 RepID=UPI000A07406D|nr:hypothetical protein [Actinomadura kijaniata]